MRPTGEIRAALRDAAHALVASLPPDRGVTVRELASAANVGADAALTTIRNMARPGGELEIVGDRKVDYRNRPVAEYRPIDDDDDAAAGAGFVDLGTALTYWSR